MSPFILFIGEHPLIYYTLFINELKGGTLGNVPINYKQLKRIYATLTWVKYKVCLINQTPTQDESSLFRIDCFITNLIYLRA